MFKMIRKDPHLVTYFTNQSITTQLQNFLITPDSTTGYILALLTQTTTETLYPLPDSLLTSLFYTHQTHSTPSTSVIKIFSQILKLSPRQLINHVKDIYKFGFESFEPFKSENDTVVKEAYHQPEVVTIDMVYFLS